MAKADGVLESAGYHPSKPYMMWCILDKKATIDDEMVIAKEYFIEKYGYEPTEIKASPQPRHFLLGPIKEVATPWPL